MYLSSPSNVPWGWCTLSKCSPPSLQASANFCKCCSASIHPLEGWDGLSWFACYYTIDWLDLGPWNRMFSHALLWTYLNILQSTPYKISLKEFVGQKYARIKFVIVFSNLMLVLCVWARNEIRLRPPMASSYFLCYYSIWNPQVFWNWTHSSQIKFLKAINLFMIGRWISPVKTWWNLCDVTSLGVEEETIIQTVVVLLHFLPFLQLRKWRNCVSWALARRNLSVLYFCYVFIAYRS